MIARVLHNRLMWFTLRAAHHRGKCGFHQGRIVKAFADRHESVTTITVAMFNTATLRFNGRRVRLHPDDWHYTCDGIVWRGRVMQPDAFLAHQLHNRQRFEARHAHAHA